MNQKDSIKSRLADRTRNKALNRSTNNFEDDI